MTICEIQHLLSFNFRTNIKDRFWRLSAIYTPPKMQIDFTDVMWLFKRVCLLFSRTCLLGCCCKSIFNKRSRDFSRSFLTGSLNRSGLLFNVFLFFNSEANIVELLVSSGCVYINHEGAHEHTWTLPARPQDSQTSRDLGFKLLTNMSAKALLMVAVWRMEDCS